MTSPQTSFEAFQVAISQVEQLDQQISELRNNKQDYKSVLRQRNRLMRSIASNKDWTEYLEQRTREKQQEIQRRLDQRGYVPQYVRMITSNRSCCHGAVEFVEVTDTDEEDNENNSEEQHE